ncbi:MAG TPA: DUF362 domain-containing protein [Bryobacteraceae bacterium]|nr:DUF362 domain-containing protein [Bryobacteraceae bacterium]
MFTRRQTVIGLGAFGFGACRRQTNLKVLPSVSIHRAPGYTNELYGLMKGILAQHQVDARGRRIVLKPNLVEFDERTAINTNPVFVHAIAEAFHSLGAASVVIAEGPGHRRITLDLAEAAGYENTFRGFPSVFTDLNLDEVTRVTLRNPVSRLRSLYLPQTVLNGDLLVSLPKMKTHHWVGATLSMKNLFGVVPGSVYGWPKNILHWAGIEESIVDINGLFPKRFAIVDGIVGMEGNGPIQGTPKKAGVIVAGFDPVAVDATCCRIMEIDPEQIGYLVRAQTAEQTRHQGVRQIGERIEDVRSPFALLPQFKKIRLARA